MSFFLLFSFASAFYFSKVVKKKKGGISLFVTICAHSGDGDDGVVAQSRISNYEMAAFDANLPPPEPTGVVLVVVLVVNYGS